MPDVENPRRWLAVPLTFLLCLGLSGPVAAAPPAPDTLLAVGTPVEITPPDGPVELEHRSRPVAPGVRLDSFTKRTPYGWVRGDLLTTDLTAGSTVDYLSPGTVAAAEPVSVQATRQRAVAAVNGDFFDINASNAPLGPAMDDGELVKSPSRTWADFHNVAAIDAQGAGRILQLYFEGTVTLPTGDVTLDRLNSPEIPQNGIGAYTALWGSYSRAQIVSDAARVTEVVLEDGVVTEISDTAGEGPIPDGAMVLVGREQGADVLAGLTTGDQVTVTYRPRTSDDSELVTAIGGRDILVIDGKPQTFADQSAHPRTAIGFSKDGQTMYLLTVDGRADGLAGLTLDQLAEKMAALGAYSALNLDGGGSSTLVARKPGGTELLVENNPSDGQERPVPNGLAIMAPAGSGTLHGFWVETAIDPLAAPTVGPRPGGRPDRVFPGLTRRLTAQGYDETYGPAEGTPTWRVTPGSRGTIDAHGVFRATRSGTVRVTASKGKVRGEIELHVLGRLARIVTTTERVSLADGDAVASFGVVGYDGAGYSAPIEPEDVTLEYDTTLLSITPGENGALEVRARKDTGSALITVTVGDVSTVVPVTVGFEDRMVADFADADQWTFSHARAAGSIAPATGHDGGPAVKLTYDFTLSDATRAAYANPPALIEVPGQPQAFSMWVHGNGTGEWIRMTLQDANGQDVVIDGPNVTWHGWRQIEMSVPAGVAYPLKIRRVYAVEIQPTHKYHSEVIFDDITAKLPPEIELPERPTVIDPVVVTDGTVTKHPWRFAVMSDAQFVARDPDSDLVAKARRTLREVKAARPDFLVINGDLVDEASPEDFALAKQILTEELGDSLPWYYLPGNHEIMGGPADDPLRNFREAFGEPQRVFDHNGTRFVMLDSSSGALGLTQLQLLRGALDSAAKTGSVGSVVALWHHPPRDPTPQQASLMSDRREAALVERWLAEFRLSTGKAAAMVNGHVGVFAAAHQDGVPYLVNGNSGKTPAAAPADGGFTGWTLIGVDPVSPGEAAWVRKHPYHPAEPFIRAELRPHVDALDLAAPDEVAVGETATVTATAVQGEREIPVGYPVSADWSGSANLHIGDVDDAKRHHVAAFDPATGGLIALRAGTVTLAVTVNGIRQEVMIRVTG